MSFPTIRIWVAVLMLLDVAIGMLCLDRWQKLLPVVNVRRLIAIECVAAVTIVAIHFWAGS